MRVHAFCLNVPKLEETIEFATATFGLSLKEIAELDSAVYERLFGAPGSARLAFLQFGNEAILLVEHSEPDFRQLPEAPRSNDLWFQHVAIVVKDLDAAHRAVLAAGCEAISHGPQTIPESNQAAAGIRAFYFREPRGHPMELIWFPPGKGRPRWQEPSARLFLGIDHAAIAVSDTRRSLLFYREICGMTPAGESLNEGITQQELSGVPGARVKITGLRYPNDEGPGIEFLQYLEPSDGRPWPAAVTARLNGRKMSALLIQDLEGALKKIRADDGAILGCSAGLPSIFGSGNGAIVSDPDGHLVLLLEG